MAYVLIRSQRRGLGLFGNTVLDVTWRDVACRGASPFQFTDYCEQYREHQDLLKAQNTGQFNLPPEPAPYPSPALTPRGYTNETVDDIIAAGAARQREQMQRFFESLPKPSNAGEGGEPRTEWLLWIGMGILGTIAVKLILDRQ